MSAAVEIPPHDHTYDLDKGTARCVECLREAIVCPTCVKCSLCAVGINPADVYGKGLTVGQD